jgi:hypothetical protein
MTVIGALSSFRKRGEMSPHKRACRYQPRIVGIRTMRIVGFRT